MWLTVSGITVMRLVPQGPSWWCMPCLVKMDASKEDSGSLVGHVASPFDLFRTFLVVRGNTLTETAYPGQAQ